MLLKLGEVVSVPLDEVCVDALAVSVTLPAGSVTDNMRVRSRLGLDPCRSDSVGRCTGPSGVLEEDDGAFATPELVYSHGSHISNLKYQKSPKYYQVTFDICYLCMFFVIDRWRSWLVGRVTTVLVQLTLLVSRFVMVLGYIVLLRVCTMLTEIIQARYRAGECDLLRGALV